MIPFTDSERSIIAEFVYSKQTDILIVSDITNLIEVLSKHNLITDKESWLKRNEENSGRVAKELNEIMLLKISTEQGQAIMDEYYGHVDKSNTQPKEQPQEQEKQQEQAQKEECGVGKESNSKAFDTVNIRGNEFDLIHGEYPHSRRDNTTYARSKENPKIIYDFDGHRMPFKIEIEEYNYLKSSSLSGDQIRKGCSGKLFLDGVQVYECGGRNYDRAYQNIQRFIDDMEMNWGWFPKKLHEEKGRIVKYEGQFFRIKSFVVPQGCMILETVDGQPRKPFQYESEDVENGDFETENSIKVQITSPHIWWHPTKKELEQFEPVNEAKN